MIHFKELLKENNLKSTNQRLTILQEINNSGHIDLDSLYGNIKEQFPTLALATLYRNIGELKERGVLSEIKIPKQKSVYEITKERHLHLVCECCGKIEDYPFAHSDVVEEISNKSGYSFSGVNIVLNGICKECSNS